MAGLIRSVRVIYYRNCVKLYPPFMTVSTVKIRYDAIEKNPVWGQIGIV